MPCNTIRRNVIKLENSDPTLLAKALEALGLTVVTHPNGVLAFHGLGGSGYFAAGKITHDASLVTKDRQSLDENLVKQAYSGQVVQAAAQRFGWKVNQKAPNQFVAQRRA